METAVDRTMITVRNFRVAVKHAKSSYGRLRLAMLCMHVYAALTLVADVMNDESITD